MGARLLRQTAAGPARKAAGGREGRGGLFSNAIKDLLTACIALQCMHPLWPVFQHCHLTFPRSRIRSFLEQHLTAAR